jgi:O-antigen/teichoic acid export membrane protein
VNKNNSKKTFRLALKWNFAWSLAGNGIYAACQWGMLILLAKTVAPELVGEYALALAVAAPIVMFANLQLRTILATDANDEFHFSEYLTMRLVTAIIALLLTVCIGVVAVPHILPAVVGVGVIKCIESISDIFYGYLQKCERMDVIAQSRILKGPLALVGLGVPLISTGELIPGLAGVAVAHAVIFWFYDRKLVIHLMYMQNKEGLFLANWSNHYKSMLLSGLPMGLVMLLISLNTNIPRYFIENEIGKAALGIFAALAYLKLAGGQIMSALATAILPRLAQLYGVGDLRKFIRLSTSFGLIAGTVGGTSCVVALLAGEQLLNIVYGQAYAAYTNEFMWLMVAGALSYFSYVFGAPLSAMRLFKVQPVIAIIRTAVLSLACFWLIPRSGLLGAALATVCGECVNIICSSFIIVVSIRVFRKPVPATTN